MSEQVLDINDVMERVQDDRELLLELLDIFEEDYADKRNSFDELVKNQDAQQIKDIAHSIKGAAGNISAKAIYTTCSEIEKMGEKNDLSRINEMFSKLDEQFKELQIAFAQLREDFKDK